ncbi:ATP-binding cassette domain-containing protein [Lactiplantibacillus daowaiensis]|uniref:ATP-binding cassette domain-containing protein n=1 Tax=Lactiplantibacillus daowaiensis TaxID=2559918 RepID=A0ABW1S3T2_9LACO|nr:ABC transporter ATP-binding protein [Lactiplantibacillus daowaiensis]
MATIALNNLTFTYPQAVAPTLQHVSLTFTSGHFTLLTGPSGTGKSTLLKLMTGLLPLDDPAAIQYDQVNLSAIDQTDRAAKVAMLFQNPNQQFAMDTVENELVFALENRQVDPTQMAARITAALDFVGISALRQRKLLHLSGGEKQKVALAVIVAMDSDVILLDEPFASVDPTARASLLRRLVQLRDKAGKTIILADHDLTDYQALVDDVVKVTPARNIVPVTVAQRPALFQAFEQRVSTTTTWPQPTSGQPAFKLHQLALTQGQHQLLQPTDLTLFQQHVTLITGPNGSGKSTFFEALVRLHAYQGRISYAGQDIQRLKRRAYARQVALLFQDAETQFLNITVQEELAQSQKHAAGTYFTTARIQQALAQLNLAGRDEQVIYTLSEGQKKKLQILLMLIMQPPVLLMDEPLKGLDLASINALVQLLQTTLAATQQTLVIISHQLTGLTPLIDYHLHFDQQQLRYQGVPHES